MTGHEMTGRPATRTSVTAAMLAEAIEKVGYKAKAADHELAVKVFGADGNQICIVWLPSGETAFNDLGDKYLWGRTGDEHQAPDSTGLKDLVAQIVSTLP